MEKHPWESTYVYCGNNPINRIDPTGMDWIENNKTKQVEWRPDVNKDNTPKGFKYIGTEYMGLTITIFKNVSIETINGAKGEALKIGIAYNSPDGKKDQNYNWVQTVTRDGKNTFVDVGKEQDEVANYPFYQGFSENKKALNEITNDISYYDRPTEWDKNGTFTAELSLIGIHNSITQYYNSWNTKLGNYSGINNYSNISTLRYGFEVVNNKFRALPITIVSPSLFQQETIKQIR